MLKKKTTLTLGISSGLLGIFILIPAAFGCYYVASADSGTSWFKALAQPWQSMFGSTAFACSGNSTSSAGDKGMDWTCAVAANQILSSPNVSYLATSCDIKLPPTKTHTHLPPLKGSATCSV